MKVNRKNHLQQNKTRKQIVQYSHSVHLMLKKKKHDYYKGDNCLKKLEIILKGVQME